MSGEKKTEKERDGKYDTERVWLLMILLGADVLLLLLFAAAIQ